MTEVRKLILVIGLGSMGKRRIRLMSERDDVVIFGVDGQEERRREAEEKFGVITYPEIDEAIQNVKFECAFVCTSPLSHADIIHKCLENNLHVFTEINLVSDRYEENIELAKSKGLVLFLSSTFLYRKETKYLIEEVRKAKCNVNYIYHVGQYLPDWHPWENYNNYFIGNNRTNGCREIMAIDFPWLVSAFGRIRGYNVIKGKNSELNINYNDNYLIQLVHETGHKGVFAVDVISRKPYRHIDIYGESLQLYWNGTPDSLYMYDIEQKKDIKIDVFDASEHIDGYASFITENPYREEINTFFELVAKPDGDLSWDFHRDKELLNLIDRIDN